MFRGSFIFRMISLLVVLALLAVGGSLLFRSGYSQGFVAGSLAAGAEGGTGSFPAVPYGLAPFRWYGQGYGFSPFGPILGLLFFGGLILLVFGLFSRPFRGYHRHFSRWHTEEGPHWTPEAWDEHRKAWRRSHESAQEETNPEPGEQSGHEQPK